MKLLLVLFFLCPACVFAGICDVQYTQAIQTHETAGTLSAGPFQYGSSTEQITVKKNKTTNLGNNNITDYQSISVEQHGTLNFISQGTHTKYYLETLDIQAGGIVNFVPGEYWIENLKVDQGSAQINVQSGGRAKIFIQNTVALGKQTTFNANTNETNPAQKLWIYAYSDFMLKEQNTELVGFVYSEKQIQLQENAILTGAVVAEKIEIAQKAKVVFEPSALISPCVPQAFATHFTLSHTPEAIYCVAEPVEVTAKNGASIQTQYTGTITLDTKQPEGQWVLIQGKGVFTPLSTKNGQANYTFSIQDNGTARFGIIYGGHKKQLKLAVYETNNPAVQDDNTHTKLNFSPSGFLITNAPNGTLPYANNQIAGQGETLYIKAFSDCGAISGYEGTQELAFWYELKDPTLGTVAVTINNVPIGRGADQAVTLPIHFESGLANVFMNYRDVGRIQIFAKKGILIGETNPFVVKPAKLVVQVPDNPGALDHKGPLFKKAGEPFTLQITVEDIDGNLTPSFGYENTPVGLQAYSSEVILPRYGRNGSDNIGTLINGDHFQRMHPGKFECTSCAYDEVGIIKLQAHLKNNDYLGSGDVLEKPETQPVGRFSPDHLTAHLATEPIFATSCQAGGFTYLDQPFRYEQEGAVLVSAKSYAGTTTQNYTGDFWKLSVEGLNTTYRAQGSVPLEATNAMLPAAIEFEDHTNGSGTYHFGDGGGIQFKRTNGVNQLPFEAKIQYEITLKDSDNIVYANNPFTVGDLSGQGIAFNESNTIRHGRMVLTTAIGSELQDLNLPLEVQYYFSNTNGFVRNVQDSCTQITNPAYVLLSLEPSSLSSTAVVTAFSNGNGLLTLLKPTPQGKTGYVEVEIDLSSSGLNVPWLQYDWPQDGNYDGIFNDNPKARGTFGKYGGPGGVIHQRERY